MLKSMSKDHKSVRVTTIGGGSGQPQLLRALAEYPEYILTGIVTTMDSGGSSGVLRDEYGMVPPGDIRRSLSALVEDPSFDAWWNYRIESGSLKNHTIGNLVLAGLCEQHGSMSKAVAEFSKTVPVRGRVLPVSDSAGVLCAELADGTIVRSEHMIDVPTSPRAAIKKVFLEESIQILPQTREALLRSEYILLSCGDAYTSVIPNLLVPGVSEAIAEGGATVVLVCNRSTKKGETDGWSYMDLYREVSTYLAPATLSLLICDDQTTPMPKGYEAFRRADFPESVTVLCEDFADAEHPERVSLQKIVDSFSSYARLH